MATYAGKLSYEGSEMPIGSTLYGTCSTAAGTAQKDVTLANFDALLSGVTIHVKFTYSNTASNPTLKVGSTTAKSIVNAGWNAGAVVSFTYDGTNWIENGSSVTEEDLNDLKQTLNHNKIAIPLNNWINGKYRRTNGTTISAEYSNESYRSLVVACQSGDQFEINANCSGSSYVHTYAFTDSNGVILDKGQYSTDAAGLYAAPASAAYLYINDKNSGQMCYKHAPAIYSLNRIKTAISNVHNLDIFPLLNVSNQSSLNGIRYTPVDEKTYHISGTSTNRSHKDLLTIDSSVFFLAAPNEKLKFRLFTQTSGVFLYLQYTLSDSTTVNQSLESSEIVELLPDFVSLSVKLIVSSGLTVDENVSISIISHLSNDLEDTGIKILCIGNSFTSDCVSYVPALMKSIAGIPVTLAKTYYSGAKITQYIDWFNNDSAVIDYHKYNVFTSSWGSEQENKTLKEIIADEAWDIITFSPGTGDINSNTPANLNILIYKVLNYYASIHDDTSGVKIGWLEPQLYPRDISTDAFNDIVEFMQDIANRTPVDFMIPAGTAIENARTTSLDNLGVYGHMAYDSTGHIQAGIPSLTLGYTLALSFLALFGESYNGILWNGIRPTDEWITSQHAFHHGNSEGVNDNNCYLAQKCAIEAMKKPYEITTISEAEIPT